MPSIPLRAVILAAGKGSRLGNAGLPKVIAPVAGVPLLHRTLQALESVGVRTTVIVVGHRAGEIVTSVSGSRPAMRVVFVQSARFASTNNAYSLWLARRWLTEDLFVLDGDVVFDGAILGMLAAAGAPAASGVVPWRPGMDGTVMELTGSQVSAVHLSGGPRSDTDAAALFKTINIHLLRRNYLDAEFVPLLDELIACGGEQSFYEEVLARTVRRDRFPVAGVDCAVAPCKEVDDGTDLEIASFAFGSPQERQEMLARQHGGYWRHPVTDHCLLTNPYFPPARMLEDLTATFGGAVTGYPAGQDRQRELLSAVVGLPPTRLAVANGASEIIRVLGQFLTGVAVVVPCFGEYEAAFAGGPQIAVPWPELRVDIERVHQQAAEARASAVIMESPANPTSLQVPREELLRLAALLARTATLLIVDESFADFSASPQSLQADLEAYPNIAIIKSLSKAYGVAGLRLGYLACANQDLLSGVLAGLPIWNINGPAEAFLRLLPRYAADFQVSLEQVRAARDELYGMLSQRACFAQVHRPEANFVLARLASPRTASLTSDALFARHNILVKDCSGKSMPHAAQYLRLASRTRTENQRLVHALDDILAPGQEGK